MTQQSDSEEYPTLGPYLPGIGQSDEDVSDASPKAGYTVSAQPLSAEELSDIDMGEPDTMANVEQDGETGTHE